MTLTTWLLEQAPLVFVIGVGIWALVKAIVVPGYAYEREKARADRLEELLLRSVNAGERVAKATETIARTGGQ